MENFVEMVADAIVHSFKHRADFLLVSNTISFVLVIVIRSPRKVSLIIYFSHAIQTFYMLLSI